MLVAIGMSASLVLTGRRLKAKQVPNSSLVIGGLLAVVGFFVIPVVGLPVGFVCAVVLAVLVRQSMLPRGIPFEIPLAVLPWLLGSLVVSVLAVALAARPVLREPVNDLLRSVRPSSASGST